MTEFAAVSAIPIILDCDPGHDDAVAIVVAARHTRLLGITTVAGNAPLERTTTNAMVMRHLLDIDVPIHSGAERPFLAPPRHADYVHGESGLDGAELPVPDRPLDGTDAVAFIVDTCRATEGTWLVPVGPLTNIALALRAAPDLARRIGGISLMGGGTFGNTTSTAEFNIWADPEAAAVVFEYGGPLIMAGLDLTYQFQATEQRIDGIRSIGGTLPSLLADLLVFFSGTYISRHDDLGGAPVHDPCAVMALTHPELFRSRDVHVVVETAGASTRGMTVVDQRTMKERLPPNCRMLTSIDADAGFAVIRDAVAGFTR